MKRPTHARKAYASLGDDVTLTRFVKVPGYRAHGRKPIKPMPADATRTRYPTQVREPGDKVLVSGHCNVKVGRDVRKGWLRGAWIYTLTLEERATCPSTCGHWRDCYGNSMPFAGRISHADRWALYEAIERDIQRFAYGRKARPILVRLHALGDFIDMDYARFWSSMLTLYDRLHVYGYTAHAPESELGRYIDQLRAVYGRRFAIRWSGQAGSWGAPRAGDDPTAITCPEQLDKTRACATCGLCWTTDRAVAFIDH